jgi:flagellar capping protein FliD
MTKKNRLKLLFKSLFVQFGSVKTDEGIQLLWDEDGELLAGYNVYIEQETESGDLEYVPAPDGEYKSGETVFVIENGVCVEVRKEEPEAEPEAQAETSEENLEEHLEDNPAEISEEVVEVVEDPAFDVEKAIADLRSEYDTKLNELNEKYDAMKAQLDELLALPVDENAFSKESKNETQKPLFKTRK